MFLSFKFISLLVLIDKFASLSLLDSICICYRCKDNNYFTIYINKVKIIKRKRFQKCPTNTSRNPQSLQINSGDNFIYVSLNFFSEILFVIFII